MEKMEQLRTIWKRYINYYVVSNYELKEATFHNIAGTLLTMRNCGYIESARKMSTRYSIFSFQTSGTGKSEVMKATHRLLVSLGVPSRYTQKDNEACCIGSVYMQRSMHDSMHEEKKKKKDHDTESIDDVKIIPGLLSGLYAYFWDEGNVIIVPSSYMDTLPEELMGVMDEPGWVSKGMKLGTVGYPSNASIMSGTYKIPEFKKGFLESGFLQRMSLSYKVFSKMEARNIRIGIGLLKQNVNFERVEEMLKAFKTITSTLPMNKWLTFEDEAIEKNNVLSEKIFREYIEDQFSGLKQQILETFYNRFHLLVDKIATQRALINGSETVTYDDVIYSINRNKWHLDSLLRIFEYISSERGVTEPEKREKTIMNLISENSGQIDKTELKDKLMELYKQGVWDLGVSRTSKLLDDMVDKRIIHCQAGENNKKVLILA